MTMLNDNNKANIIQTFVSWSKYPINELGWEDVDLFITQNPKLLFNNTNKELDKEEVFNFILDWLDEHLNNADMLQNIKPERSTDYSPVEHDQTIPGPSGRKPRVAGIILLDIINNTTINAMRKSFAKAHYNTFFTSDFGKNRYNEIVCNMNDFNDAVNAICQDAQDYIVFVLKDVTPNEWHDSLQHFKKMIERKVSKDR